MGNAIERIGQEVPAFEAFLNETYGEDNWTLNTFGIIGDLTVLDEHGALNPITFHFSDARRWVQEALLTEVVNEVLKAREAEEPEELGPGEEQDIDAA